MKWIGSLLLAALLSTIWAVVATNPAGACSCAASGEQNLIDGTSELGDNALLFRGEQVSQRKKDDSSLWLTFRIDRMYVGDFDGTEIDVESDNGDFCGRGPQAESGVAAFAAARKAGGDWRLDQCYEPANPAIVEAILDGLPPPASESPPEFIVGHSFGPSNLALLDAQGQVTLYGEGAGAVLAASACPGGEHVVVVTGRPVVDANLGSDSFTFEVRAIADLAVVSSTETTIDRARWPQSEIRDVQCHTSDGSLLTALASRVTYDDDVRVAIPGTAQLIVVEQEALRAFEMGPSRGVTVDADERIAYSLTGEGRHLERWDIDEGVLRDQVPLPDNYVGSNVELADGVFTILARPRSLDAGPDPYPRVNVALVGLAEALEPYPLGVGGALVDITATSTGTMALLRNPDNLVTITTSGDVTAHALEIAEVWSFAMGSERTFAGGGWQRQLFELASARGPLLPMTHLGPGSVIEALGPVEDFSLPAEPSAALVARLAAEEEVAALAAATARGNTGGLPWTPIVIATLAVAALAGLGLVARAKRTQA